MFLNSGAIIMLVISIVKKSISPLSVHVGYHADNGKKAETMTQNVNAGNREIDWNRQGDWNRKVIEEFHANGGKMSGPFAGSSLLLLHTTGAKSGQPRTSPLMYYRENGRIFIFASKAGAPTNPDWYHNIVAHPEVTVEIGTEKFPVTGVVVGEEERAQMYAKQAALSPQFAEYEKTTTRKIPVVELIKK